MHADGVKKFKIIVKNEKKSYYMNFKNNGKLIINAVYISEYYLNLELFWFLEFGAF